MPNTILLPLLADGEFHSGQDLAAALGISRTAIWKQLNKLKGLGLEIESVKGRGYRIPDGIDLIDEAKVRSKMTAIGLSLLKELSIQELIDSTNMEALRRVEQGARSGLVCTAEQQTAGRGRRGREWISPFGRNLYVSTVWEFSQGAAALEGLSLAVGVAVARALTDLGLPEVQLKWPNDILYRGKKLGGVLLEMVGDASGQCQVVVGIGLNVAMPRSAADSIDQAWTDVSLMAEGGVAPGRNELLGSLLGQLLPLLAAFESDGFTPWREPWQSLDAHAGKSVILTTGNNKVAGIARGVDPRGALRLETSVGVESVFGGEISLRIVE
ncbi:MAG: bifunctional biotin--[acetyl-CoA-carboxylase] ligase/biotin operon repressor BirA [Halioglobus sp.]